MERPVAVRGEGAEANVNGHATMASIRVDGEDGSHAGHPFAARRASVGSAATNYDKRRVEAFERGVAL